MASSPTPRLSVLGTGYLGATHAACMAELGFEVLALDVDEAKIARLSAGDLPFFEPGLAELLRKSVESGRLRFTTSYEEVGEFADAHFLCVGTPQRPDGYSADLSYVTAAATSLAPHLRRPALLVGKSTVPAGTAARVEALLRGLAPAGSDVEVAWNPEFLREGFAVEDTLHPDRLVFGVESPAAERTLRTVFAPVIEAGCPVVITDRTTAELAKVAANAFLATKISFINAMAEVCEATGADVTRLADSIGYDDRIGSKFLRAGVGFGGGCLPKDIRAFRAAASELGVGDALGFLREVDSINERRRDRTVELAVDLLDGSIDGAKVTVFGAAFKPNSDDIRDSPALAVATRMNRLGARVTVYDPAGMDNARAAYPELTYADTAMAAAAAADVVMLLTEWTEFREIDPVALGQVVARRNMVDGRLVLDPVRWRAASWTYRAPGRP